MKLLKQWASVLKDIREELATSTLPLRKGKFARHYFAVKPTLRRFQVEKKALSKHMQTYQELLDHCREAIRKKNRAHAVATLRYLEIVWLKQFAKLTTTC